MIAGLASFYQMGFVANDLDAATAALGQRFGITRFRRKRSSDWLETAHAWSGEAMIEVMKLSDGAPAFYDGYLPDSPGGIRLHHHGYRVPDDAAWDALRRKIAEDGLEILMDASVMGGDLKAMYVDTRADLGIYSELVLLKGSALGIYDDVPRN